MRIKEEISVFKRGVIDLISEEELEKKLIEARRKDRPLRIKYGADPSCPDIHLGHTVPLRKLRELQDLGHQVIFLIGDFTAQIGDPSGRSETRKVLSKKEVKQNAKTYQEQVFRILDRKKTVVRYNSEWLEKFKPADFMNLMAKYTVARLIERDDFRKRFEAKKPITLLEFLYPLLQGYDSVMLESDVEIGGTDQKFNLLVGRDLQRDAGQEAQIVMTLPLIEGTDGVQKMSKSFGNYIGVTESPKEMFGKIMSIPDDMIGRYFRYLTTLSEDEIRGIDAGMKKGNLHPRDEKARLAGEIVKLFYDEKKARKASEQFDKVFKHKEIPEEMPSFEIPSYKTKNGKIDVLDLLEVTELVKSRGEGRRIIEQSGLEIDGRKIKDFKKGIKLSDKFSVIKCGKRRFAKVRVK